MRRDSPPSMRVIDAAAAMHAIGRMVADIEFTPHLSAGVAVLCAYVEAELDDIMEPLLEAFPI